jgi:hypothetical protein
MLPSDEKLTSRETSRRTGLAQQTLAKMRCRGGGPPYLKLGRRVVYVGSDLDGWLSGRRVRNTVEGDRLPRRLTEEPSETVRKKQSTTMQELKTRSPVEAA